MGLTNFDPLNESTWADDLCQGPRRCVEPTHDDKLRKIAKAYQDGRLDRFEYAKLCSELNYKKRIDNK